MITIQNICVTQLYPDSNNKLYYYHDESEYEISYTQQITCWKKTG